ncbi:GDP-L-fucose synthase [Parabacteroides sp. PF5-6]|uniref:GDP-L-fucose synthase family protein n=1 Tax=Parabacteroides sp. PF5-6 TaxID=1742403 RepID=UPI002405CC09|nr:GDP-L-fucose synthase [Parabacteroides sp. PF5-6]MDF9831531.1 GDP-L-fucose synthase [Parabacteroides sp. PF5-6]
MNSESKIYIAGHTGLVGSAILHNLKQKGYRSFLLQTHKELDLTDQAAVLSFFERERPEYVFLAAAHVGGILANHTYRADFIYNNLMIQNNVIHAAYRYGAKKLLFLGSTCIYPKDAPQPMPEDCLLTSPLEYTNEPYAIAKIAGIKMCESYNLQYGTNFISVMPTNLYGPNDNFNLETSHVVPAIIRKMHLAKCLYDKSWDLLRRDLDRRPIEGIGGEASEELITQLLSTYGISAGRLMLWGTGNPMRELLWSEDMADACTYLMEKVDFAALTEGKTEVRNTHINIGTGKDSSIRGIAQQVKAIVGYQGGIEFDASKPDGTFRKLTDVRRLQSLGWQHKVEQEEGLARLYNWYLQA